MGKIVKYCSSCDEGFAEKFGFCPDCGAPLQAFEMSPVDNEEVTEPVSVEPAPVETEIDATPIEVEPEVPAPVFLQADDEPVEEIEEPEVETFSMPAAAAAPVFYQTAPAYADVPRASLDEATSWDYTHSDDGGFYVTVIEEKNGKQRNGLLLGAAALVLVLTVGGWGISLFQKDLAVGAIGDETSLAYLGVDVPMPVEDEQEKKADDDDGGGGGGGREDKEETSQGDLADQTKNPIIHPDARIYKTDNPDFLKQPVAATEGNKKFEKVYDRYGDPNSRFAGLSNGPGSGGGQGTGYGQGQGSGYGTGAGSGSGSGYGSGNGDGNGDGSGRGGNGPPPAAIAKTTPYKITAIPKATYTDTARANNVQGAVRLKITLLASGQVGSIVPVTRLPDGLTERAIAAARQIRFEPKMVNGVPVSVTITREYTFTIY